MQEQDMQEDTNIEEITDRIATLLNEASLSSKESVKLTNLKNVQELILHKSTTLLDNFLEEILQFQLDKSVEVKKFIIQFIEEACKRDNEVIFKVIDNFRYLFYDENINVQKRAFLAMINIFKNTLKCIALFKTNISDLVSQTWLSLIDIKNHIVAELDSENDGIRTAAIKFIEMLIIVLSPRSRESLVPANNDKDISLDQLNDEQHILNKLELLEEGRQNLRKLLDYTLSTHISSVNLIASIIVLSNVAKQRPEYMQSILEAFAKLNKNWPPTLGKSQVSSVKKQMKMQLLLMCKSPYAVDYQSLISNLLADSGASSSEIAKSFPKLSGESRKRNLPSVDLNVSKKPKIIPTSSVTTRDSSKQQDLKDANLPSLQEIVDDLTTRLNVQENVADLVIHAMAFLPDKMPNEFQSSYKPIAASGTIQQVKELARMLAIQFEQAKLIQYKEKMNESVQVASNTNTKGAVSSLTVYQGNQPTAGVVVVDENDDDDDDDQDDDIEIFATTSPSKASENSSDIKKPPKLSMNTASTTPVKPLPMLESLVSKKKLTKNFKLMDVTNQASMSFTNMYADELLYKTYKRILASEESVSKNKNAQLVRKRVIVDLTSLPNYKNHLTNYIFEDVRKRIDLGSMWIFNNYFNLKQTQIKKETNDDEMKPTDIDMRLRACESEYDRTLYSILYNLQQRQDPKDFLFSKNLCQVPLLTDNCVKLLKNACEDEKRYFFSINTLCELISTRLKQRHHLLKILLDLTHFENETIRLIATTRTLEMYKKKEYTDLIKTYASERLALTMLPKPPKLEESNGSVMPNDVASADQWTEEVIRVYLYLFLDIMSIDHQLIHILANVYMNALPEVKRVILKMVELPIRNIGMKSNELLMFIAKFPSGCETLVLRIIHILTEKSTPTYELVSTIKELYDKRIKDVRFLIPILTSLPKKDIINSLPSLIKLSQPVVKEVFNRLLGINTDPLMPKSQASPVDILVALHQIDPSTCDLKMVINATSICFAEKQIYTQEVLASVMQYLIDITPIPTLFMRTVIQSVSMYNKLSSFVLIIMQRLIGKQVWKNEKVWEGFIKLCQRIKPIAHQILFQLPPAQLANVINVAPDLKDHLVKHLQTLDIQKKSLIPESLLQVIESNGKP